MSAETELFRGYENEFFEVSNKSKRLLADVKNQSGDARRRTLQNLDKQLETATKLIKDMNYEANSIVSSRDISEKLKQRVKTFERDVEQMKSDVKKQKDGNSGKQLTERDALLGAYNKKDELEIAKEDHKRRLISSTNRLENSSDSVSRSLAMLDEAEQIGIDTSIDVRKQGEQLRRTIDRVDEMNQDITTGGKIITRMSRRQITNRIILVLIILGLLVIIGIILYFIIKPIVNKYKKKKQQ